MQRRRLLSALASLGFLGLAPRVQADMRPGPPPPRLEVQPEPATFVGTPTEVLVVVRNPNAEALEIQGVRLLISDAGMRFPLHVTRLEVDGQRSGVYDPISIAPSASRRLRIVFDQVPPSVLRGRTIDFLIRLGNAAEGAFTLRRA